MTFTNNDTWFAVLIILHVFGAIAGIGPTYAYAIIGSLASKASPEGAHALLRAMVRIEKAMPRPTFFVLQPLTGALLIFNRQSIRDNFWREEWLIVSLILYVILWVLILQETRNMEAQLALADAGKMETEEFGGRVSRSMKIGPVLTLLGTVLILMMIWKPGSECVIRGVLRC